LEKPGQVNQVSSTALEDSNNNQNGGAFKRIETNGIKVAKEDDDDIDVEEMDEDESMDLDEEEEEEEDLIKEELVDDLDEDIEDIDGEDEETLAELKENLAKHRAKRSKLHEHDDEDIDVEN
jgi:hypothetical protein